jgi:uncharacterized membrane protein
MFRPMLEPAPQTEASLSLTVLAAVVAGLVVYIVHNGFGAFGQLAVACSAVFFSKLVIFGGNIENLRFDPWELGLMAWVLDLLVSIALLAGIASFERLPLAGELMHEAHLRAGLTMRVYPGLRRMAIGGITLLVFLPIPGSGAVTGTLVGRLVGLSRTSTFLCVGIGSGLAAVAYAGVAVFLGSQWKAILQSPLIVIPSLIGIGIFGWWAWLAVKRELRRR